MPPVKGSKSKKASPGDLRLGNKFWQIRSKHGRDKLFKTPELLWDAACEYFEWCDNNPLTEDKGFAFQGVVTHESFAKLRPYTLEGLCRYCDCNTAYFRTFKSQMNENNKDFNTVIQDIEDVIHNQQYSGAATELLNPNIVARKLGIKDSQEISGSLNIAPLPPITIERKL
jgi:hypothetical protein